MATFEQIAEVRLRVNDPDGFQSFEEKANAAALPETPDPYTAYKLTDTGAYVSTSVESGAVAADYSRLQLRVSDSRISSWIDTYSVDQAECKALDAIATRLGAELRIKRAEAGAESTEWIDLQKLYQYYVSLSSQCKERYNQSQGNSTGRYGTSDQPQIAGGEI
jgi:hypothetical protein